MDNSPDTSNNNNTMRRRLKNNSNIQNRRLSIPSPSYSQEDFDRSSSAANSPISPSPGTPWNEIDLSELFLFKEKDNSVAKKKSFIQSNNILSRRRMFFVLGGLLGAFLGWLFTDGPVNFSDGTFLDLDLAFTNVKEAMTIDPSAISNILPQLNLSDLLPNSGSKSWLKNLDFTVGRQAFLDGRRKNHSVLLIPGIISSGLESWGTSEEHAPFFRKRIWGTTTMIKAVVTRKEAWLRAISLDLETGLDPEGVKVRAAQGFDAAAYFVQGYWIWQKIIENLAVVGYDPLDMALMSYDWRLSPLNLEVRDKYFSRMKASIEHSKKILGKKTVLVSHSMGSSIVLFFFKWVEAEGPLYGNGGPNWVDEHIESFVNVAGTILGVPKTLAALLSGEMRDTVELHPAGVYILEKLFSRRERAGLFRSWSGSATLWPKGGDTIWGNSEGAPDDPVNATLTTGNVYNFRESEASSNLSMSKAYEFLLKHSPQSFQKMLQSNYSFGIESNVKKIKANNQDFRKWTNPLEVQLPRSNNLKIFCLYGVGKPTERGYWYKSGPYENEEIEGQTAKCESKSIECDARNQTTINSLNFPVSRQVWVDNEVNLEDERPMVKSGVTFGDGDGTVSVLSLGSMCYDGWKRDIYNPSQIPVVTHEIEHKPQGFDLRGGSTTADHIDILGSAELNEAIINIATGREDLVKEKIISDIKDYVSRIRWPSAS
ncbi:Lecithin:cholesterol acyltransferase-domain-containing protein [Phakopsora pachyrhizi]|uniref:Lecithin:cholesterol acyltransferase-domain-containing protein n=1 Tax=Phakopsora pachyrhizi TaxID=170000 RepID=A0AAV0AKG2_PHAPC|nr:Lecithin:cholesterol acyltransferase-domain-containing protein [Phakopsora pachyrhizi]